MNRRQTLGMCLIAGLTAGCVPVADGRVSLAGTQPGSTISGTATFAQTAEGLRMAVTVAGAPPGLHGLHIHERGDCGDGGNAAGGHFNPDKVKHGFLPQDGFAGAHAGDLGNIDIGANGAGTLVLTPDQLTLRDGPYAVAGRSVVLHEKRDDFGQPTGNAGGRIACGVILVRSP